MKKVGILCGREWSWPPKFLDEVNNRHAGVEAEFIKLGGTAMDEPNPYSVIIDRISHEVPYYRSYLKKAVLDGVAVINNPFMWTADDKFFGAALCKKLGLAHPNTMALPNRDYVPGIVKSESLRNLIYPLDWQAIVGSGPTVGTLDEIMFTTHYPATSCNQSNGVRHNSWATTITPEMCCILYITRGVDISACPHRNEHKCGGVAKAVTHVLPQSGVFLGDCRTVQNRGKSS